jgi:hypothetical protein
VCGCGAAFLCVGDQLKPAPDHWCTCELQVVESYQQENPKMVQLFLQVPTEGGSVDTDAVRARRSLLNEAESVIRSVVRSGGRYEARMLLCSTISSVHLLDPRDQRDLFLDLLEMKDSRRDVAARLLRMIFDKKPKKAGSVLAKKLHMLEKFFQGNSIKNLFSFLICWYSVAFFNSIFVAANQQFLYIQHPQLTYSSLMFVTVFCSTSI